MTPSEETASTIPMTSWRSQASEKPCRSLTRPAPVSECAISAQVGRCSASAFSMISPVTDCPCGTSITVTLAACGFMLSAASSSGVAARMRRVSASMPEKVPLAKATTRSPGRTAETIASSPLQPVPATPKVWTFSVPQISRSIRLHSIIPRRTSGCM